MIRTRALLVAVVLAGSSTVGCTFCETCDDFPIPVVGGAGVEMMGPPMMAPPEGTYSPNAPTGAVEGAVAPPSETGSPFVNPEAAGEAPFEESFEEGMDSPVISPPPSDAPESSVPLPGTADESLPGTVPDPDVVIPPSDASILPAPTLPEAP